MVITHGCFEAKTQGGYFISAVFSKRLASRGLVAHGGRSSRKERHLVSNDTVFTVEPAN